MTQPITAKEALVRIDKKINNLQHKVELQVKEQLLYKRLEELFRGKSRINKLKGIFKIWTA